jgi:peptidoglycan glycosyltransferase
MRKAPWIQLLMPLCAGLAVAALVNTVLASFGHIGRSVASVDESVTPPAPDVQEGATVLSAIQTASGDEPAAPPHMDEPPAPTPEAMPVAVGSRAAPSSPSAALAGGKVVSSARGPSTRNATLEAQLEALLRNGQTPYGAVVIMEAATGRVVAMAEHSTREASDGIALRPLAPAASVFKVVTASALLEAGVPVNEEVCFHGGKTRMKPKNLKDTNQDNRCITFGEVVPQSANVAVAKLATSHLNPAMLREHTLRWGFGNTFGIPGMKPSTANIPNEPFAFAETAAGFGDVKISAMHGAVLASIVANDGMLVTPTMVSGQQGRAARAIEPRAARALRQMMADTVSKGTGRRAFQQRPALGQSAAGKTGSLTDYSTGLDTSWFVGFAPADAPEFIVSAVVVNTSKWHIKAPWLAKESLRAAFKVRGSTTRGARVAAR